MNKTKIISLLVLLSLNISVLASQTQLRMDQDIAAGKPLVIQISVALADNKNQWIVPVPDAIGNGQDARTNLYWGALYGVKTYMMRNAGWQKISSQVPEDDRILERLVLKKSFTRNGLVVPVYIVADAWDGRYIKDTIKQFMSYNAGNEAFSIPTDHQKIEAGGKAHLIVYIGHNALMDYFGLNESFITHIIETPDNPENDSIVLACRSEPYFSSYLKKVGAQPLVLTTGLMAPEAYTLNAIIEQWVAGVSVNQVRKAAAKSYNKYQNTGIKAAENLFGVK